MANRGKSQIHADETGHQVKYAGKWDAYFCVECDAWLEVQCTDPNCGFCTERPKSPVDHVVP